MTAYYVDYPRDFANEYTVYVVAPAVAEDFAAAFPDAQKITRIEAIRLGWTRPRQARKDGEQWYGSFAGEGDTLAEALVDTERETAHAVEMAAMVAEGY